MVLIHQRHG